MLESKEFKQTKDIAKYLKDLIDKYAGKKIPEKEQEEIRCLTEKYRTKIFRGEDFCPTMIAIMREFRLKRIREVLQSS